MIDKLNQWFKTTVLLGLNHKLLNKQGYPNVILPLEELIEFENASLIPILKNRDPQYPFTSINRPATSSECRRSSNSIFNKNRSVPTRVGKSKTKSRTSRRICETHFSGTNTMRGGFTGAELVSI